MIDEAQEERMVTLVRNALLVAGQEMGDGDHMPVVKSTITKMMHDWDQLKVESAVNDELRRSMEETIAELQAIYKESGTNFKPEVQAALKEMRDVYDAAFGELGIKGSAEAPAYMKSVRAILDTLEEEA